MTTQKATPEFSVREISSRETWPVRSVVLRPGQPLSACDYDIDSMPGAFHLGSFTGEQLLTIGSFYPDPHPDLTGSCQYRLRGMATLPDWQGRGLGFLLLDSALQRLTEQGCDLLWCNARVIAAGYYLKFGMQRSGPEFEIEGIGPHWLMFRQLS